MAKIYNSDCTKGLAQNAAIQTSIDKVPNELAEKIVPTFETNPALLRKVTFSAGKVQTTSGTVHLTIPNKATKKTFITNIYYSMVKNAACDIADGRVYINAIPKGDSAQEIIIFPVLTLTAQQYNQTINFNPPMELEMNTDLSLNGTYAAGTMIRVASVQGFQIENLNA